MKVVCWLIVCVLCFFLEYGSTEITCQSKFKDISIGSAVCPQEKCTREIVFGTVNYTDDSSVCAAAWHDGRIQPWSTDAGKRTVYWQPGRRMRIVHGTIRYGTSSTSGHFTTERPTCFFTTERLSETLYNISSVVNTISKTIQCFEDGNTNRRDSTELTIEEVGKPSAHTPSAAEITYSTFGVFFCTYSAGNNENLYSQVFTVVPQTRDVLFIPDKVTIRASVGDNLTFDVSNTRWFCDEKIRWRKDGGSLVRWNGKRQVHMIAKIERSGVYTVQCEDAKNWPTIIRLIVRVCPHGKYGGFCQFSCPVCVNGGICHDITGECICPPGFKGTTCDEACGPNLFGRECTATCDERGARNGCKAKTVCTLDPYGCSCAAGFHGVKCDKDCPAGKYGADCAQTCGSCKTGVCDRFTGHCRSGCKIGHYTDYCKECNGGWYGQNCQNQCGLCSGDEACNKSTGHCRKCQEGYRRPHCEVQVAKLNKAAAVYAVDTHSASVYWTLWVGGRDLGVGPVSTYQVEYKTTSQRLWSSYRTATPGGTLTGLQPDRTYQLRIRTVVEVDDDVLTIGRPSPMVNFTTLCAATHLPVSGLSTQYLTTTSIVFRWDRPRCESRNDLITEYEYEFQRLNYSCLLPQLIKNTTTLRIQTIDKLIPFVNYFMRVRPMVGTHKGPWSNVVTERTLCSKPPKLTGVGTGFVNSSSVQLRWEIPCPAHGPLTIYEVLANSTSAGTCRHPCSSLIVSDLLPNRRCNFKVRAVSRCPTKKDRMEGEWSDEITVQMKESVPGPPSTLTVIKDRHNLLLSWNQPRMQNGQITQYMITWMLLKTYNKSSKKLLGVVNSHVNHVISSRDFSIKHLAPGSLYQVNVSASNSAGYGPPVSRDFWTSLPELQDAPGIDVSTQKMTETTVTMSLRPAPIPQQFVSYYTIIVEKKSDSRTKRNDPVVDDSKILDFKNAKKLGQLFYITARLSSIDVEWITDFVIGDNKIYGGYFNGPLEEGSFYRFQYGYSASNDGENKTRCQYATVDGKSRDAYTEVRNFRREKEVKEIVKAECAATIGAAAGVTASIVLIGTLVGFLFYRRLQRERQQSPDEVLFAMSERKTDIPNRREEESDQDMEANTEIERCSVAVSYDQRQSLCYAEYTNVNNRVQLDDLPSFVTSGLRAGKLMDEYKVLPSGLLFDHEVASHLDNKQKNRYINIITYDKNRVELKMVDNDPQSTYINASYIDSYTRPSAFIAAQGPTQVTVNDFWRMIWEKNVQVVVMLTNLVENGKRKCHRYWPESSEPEVFGDVTVSVIADEPGSDFTIRRMSITNVTDDRKRTVTQFHFTSWPNHGVPENSGSIWKLHRVVRSEMNVETPAVIHCSTGIGRTGIFILLDILVDQLTQESLVDPLGFLYRLRQQRVNMVQRADQYEFIYNAILEYLQSEETFIPTAKFDSSFEKLLENSENGKSLIEQEYDNLTRLFSSLPVDESATASLPENLAKNRRSDVLPTNRARPVLMSRSKGKSSDYVNAVFVNSYRHRDAFLVTQIPLPSTVADFWRMMFDYDCHIIVCLSDWSESDDTWGRYWPENGSAQYGRTGVELVATRIEHDGDIVIRTMDLHSGSKDAAAKPHQVIQMELKGWPVNQHVPHPDVQASLIDLVDMVERYQKKTGNKTVVVTCLDGFTQSGVFCSFEYLASKIKVEQGVDVFQSVRHVRYNRPQFICNLEQYTALYRLAKQFMETFETYANFQ